MTKTVKLGAKSVGFKWFGQRNSPGASRNGPHLGKLVGFDVKVMK